MYLYISSVFPQTRDELEKFYGWRVEPGSRKYQQIPLAAAMDAVPFSGIASAKEAYPRLAYVMRHKKSPLPLPEVFTNTEYIIYSLRDKAAP